MFDSVFEDVVVSTDSVIAGGASTVVEGATAAGVLEFVGALEGSAVLQPATNATKPIATVARSTFFI